MISEKLKKNKSSTSFYTNFVICGKIKKFFSCCSVRMELLRYTELQKRQIVNKIRRGPILLHFVYHCQTRLRFSLADEGKADQKALEALNGVRKVMSSSGVYQVVIGTDVADVFEELEPLVGPKNGEDKAPAGKKGIINTIVDFVSSIYQYSGRNRTRHRNYR